MSHMEMSGTDCFCKVLVFSLMEFWHWVLAQSSLIEFSNRIHKILLPRALVQTLDFRVLLRNLRVEPPSDRPSFAINQVVHIALNRIMMWLIMRKRFQRKRLMSQFVCEWFGNDAPDRDERTNLGDPRSYSCRNLGIESLRWGLLNWGNSRSS